MANARVRLNRAGVIDLLKSPGVTGELERRAEVSAEEARQTAPVQSGAYRASIKTWTEEHTDRNVVRIGSEAPHGMVVEAATGNLARALDSAGGA